MIDKQAMFDRVRKHFLADMNPPGWNDHANCCTYANPPCAIGIFDTEGVLAEHRCSVTGFQQPTLKKVFPDLEIGSPHNPDSDIYFLKKLQVAHDGSVNLGDSTVFRQKLNDRLRNLARDFNLEWKDMQ